jgi:hypothetical protein
MYEKPRVVKFGTFRSLTLAGCGAPSDGRTFEGGTSVGNDGPRIDPTAGTYDYCFVSGNSR